MSHPVAPSTQRLRIVVLGHIVRMPLGGLAWHYLQYVLGLHKLGHDVYYLEDGCLFEDDSHPWYYHPSTGVTDGDPSDGLHFAASAFARLGLADRWALRDTNLGQWVGPAAPRIPEVCASADLLINVSAANPLRPDLMAIPIRIFLDTDPVFSQVRIAVNEVRRALAYQHNVYFSFGENVHADEDRFPTAGLSWKPTRQPVVLDLWPVCPPPDVCRLTTVMAWQSYREAEEYRGVRYGCKAESFGPYLNLPRLGGFPCQLALFRSQAPHDRLAAGGWSIADGNELSLDPWVYRRYLQESTAEFSVAKHAYVVGATGWFSERSACYLASGRPVVVQDTGFAGSLPCGEGLLPFSDPEGAASGIEAVLGDNSRHSRAAREIAANYFSYEKVLNRLIEQAHADAP